MYYTIPPQPMTTLSVKYKSNKEIVVHDYTDVKAKVTSYTVSYHDCGKVDGLTASGKHIKSGMIAAPSNIPFGTTITIDGKDMVVEDRGGAIVIQNDGTYVIDYYLPTRKQALDYGVQYKTIRIHGIKSQTLEDIDRKDDIICLKIDNSAMKNIYNWRDSMKTNQNKVKIVKAVEHQQYSFSQALLQLRLWLTIRSYVVMELVKKQLSNCF